MTEPRWATVEQTTYPVTLRVEGDGYVALYRFINEAARDAFIDRRIASIQATCVTQVTAERHTQ